LGFVANKRRFNGEHFQPYRINISINISMQVAITRAQALLIIVGDSVVLSIDPLWRKFLNYVHKNGGWTGDEISWDPEAQVLDDARYDLEIRDNADAEMRDDVGRVSLTLGDALQVPFGDSSLPPFQELDE
jgi:helicase MOV-10